MDPITYASAFATIVGLLSAFKGEGEARKTRTLDEYVEWLRRHAHEQVVELISNNHDLGIGIQTLLDGQHEDVLDKLRGLDEVMVGIASRLDGFEAMAGAIQVAEALSDQAVLILRQLNDSKAISFTELPTGRSLGNVYKFIGGSGGVIALADERFVLDDLEKLCSFGLLIEGVTGKGLRTFTITREGAAVGGG